MHQYTGRFKRLRCLERCHMNLYRDIPMGDVRFIGNRSPNLPHLPPLQVAEAQASTDARKEQTYEQKKEHQQLEGRWPTSEEFSSQAYSTPLQRTTSHSAAVAPTALHAGVPL